MKDYVSITLAQAISEHHAYIFVQLVQRKNTRAVNPPLNSFREPGRRNRAIMGGARDTGVNDVERGAVRAEEAFAPAECTGRGAHGKATEDRSVAEP